MEARDCIGDNACSVPLAAAPGIAHSSDAGSARRRAVGVQQAVDDPHLQGQAAAGDDEVLRAAVEMHHVAIGLDDS
jgi:hypothetical protein